MVRPGYTQELFEMLTSGHEIDSDELDNCFDKKVAEDLYLDVQKRERAV